MRGLVFLEENPRFSEVENDTLFDAKRQGSRRIRELQKAHYGNSPIDAEYSNSSSVLDFVSDLREMKYIELIVGNFRFVVSAIADCVMIRRNVESEVYSF